MDMFKLSLTPSLVAKNLPARDNRKAPTPLFGQDRISEWWMQFFDIKRCIHMFSTHWQVWVLLQNIHKFWSWGVLIKLAACFYSYITIGKIEQHGVSLNLQTQIRSINQTTSMYPNDVLGQYVLHKFTFSDLHQSNF